MEKIKFIVLLAFCVALLCRVVLSQSSNISVDNEERIIGGLPAAENQFPYLVHLNLVGHHGLANCGGSIISNSWVLTAAHCLASTIWIFVYFGSVSSTNPALTLRTDVFYIHPEYDPTVGRNDVGLIDLRRNLTFSDNIGAIRLPTLKARDNTLEGTIATVAGFGSTTSTGPASEIMYYVNLTIISNNECKTATPTEGYIVDSIMCAVGVNFGQESACRGDSGGPIILAEEDLAPTLIGVANFVLYHGKPCSGISGFARTAFFLQWIEELTGIPIRS